MNDAEPLPATLLDRIKNAIAALEKHEEIRIISHYDADGIASAGVICNALLRRGKSFQASMIKNLDAKAIAQFASEIDSGCLILSDMGSSYLDELEKIEGTVIVLDHHAPPRDSDKVFHINPHLFGLDGMTAASASAVCQLFATQMDAANWDLLPIAFAGIVGDRQHIRGLKGINEYLLTEGLSKGIVEVHEGSIIPNGKIGDALFYSVDPYFSGLSADEKGVADFLASININPEMSVDQLNESERRKIASLLALKLMKQGCTLSTLEEISHERFYFKKLQLYASDLASMLNACGRTDNEGIGLGVTLNDEQSITEAMVLRKKYKETILTSLKNLEKKGLTKLSNIQFFYSDNPNISGTVCGLAMQYLADRDKPTIAISIGDEESRVSSRATFEILEKGVDLSVAIGESARVVGGSGGGHAIASGATIPKGKENEFLEYLDRMVGEQKRKKLGA
ncbi:MAG: DHHA1 domain-containing protein [Methanomassiliicoccales archaeon]|jgi:RecJ-like exonuclease